MFNSSKSLFYVVSLIISGMLTGFTPNTVNAANLSCQAGPYRVDAIVTNNGVDKQFNYAITADRDNIKKIKKVIIPLYKPVKPTDITNGIVGDYCEPDFWSGVGRGTCAFTAAYKPIIYSDRAVANMTLTTTYNQENEVFLNIKTFFHLYTCFSGPDGTNGIIGPAEGADPAGVVQKSAIFTPNSGSGNTCAVEVFRDETGKCVDISLAPDQDPECEEVERPLSDLTMNGFSAEFVGDSCEPSVGTTSQCVWYEFNGRLYGYGPDCS